jgi:general secretion pathway protein D
MISQKSIGRLFPAACAVVLALAASAMGQRPATFTSARATSATAASTAAAEKEMIQLTLPENVEVKILLEYVTKRLGINVLYDDALVKKRVVISAPSKIPKDSLLGLLNSVLKMNGLALVDGDQPGWKRLVAVGPDLGTTGEVARDPNNLESADATTIITHVFQLKNVTTAFVDPTVKTFLSKPGGNTFAITDRNMLFVTDYAPNLRRVAEMIELLDKPGKKPAIRFLLVKNLEAGELARQVAALLSERDKLATSAGKVPEKRFSLTIDARTNNLIVISSEDEIDPALLELIQTLDVPTSLQTQTYRLKFTSPQRIDKLARDMVLGAADFKAAFKSVIDADSGLLIVTAQPALHQRIEELIAQLDVPGSQTSPQSNVRFYKLLNATAVQVLATIRTMEGAGGGKGLAALAGEGGSASILPPPKFTGPNAPPPPLGTELPTPPMYHSTSAPATAPADNALAGVESVKAKDALLTADTNTNTIIVVAPPEAQRVYQQLITILDKRRPQVMVEVTLVTLDTTGNFSLGVDMARAGTFHGDNRFLLFSSSGLSAANTTTGALTLTPGTGFNGVLLAPDIINAVVKALSSDGRTQVLSAPKVLANDNATASLSSVAEAPFTSVNASQTVSTTSFAGYASAGTTVTVTPHISEGDHLHLQYSVTLNSFTGSGSGGIPPPRQTNTLTSDVTIPDGYAIVVGGLTRKDLAATRAGFPFLVDMPAIQYLFGTHTRTRTQSTLFVFIRPVILRDDQFEDLKYLSAIDLQAACLPPALPQSEPLIME